MAAPLRAESPVPQVSQPPPQKSSDRKGGQGAAAAMAAAAAAMQGVSCIMMMNEARKMPPGSEKTMMMMMAMQQCAQAAQTAANAAQNKDGKDKASAGDSTMPQQLATQPFQTPTTDKDNSIAQNSQAPTAAESTSPEIASSDPESGPEFKPVSAEATPSPSGGDVSLAKGIPAPETSTPNTIERSKLGYDESGKASENPTPERQLGSGTTIATARPGDLSKGGTDSKQEFAPNNLDPDGRKAKGNNEAGEGGVGASDGGTGSGGGDGTTPGGNPLDAMMALLGGGGAAPEGGPKTGVTDLATLAAGGGKKGGNEEPSPNIFEYATFRYKQLNDERRLTVFRKPNPAPKARDLAKPELAHSAGQ